MIPLELINKIKEHQPFYQANGFAQLFTWKELETLINLRPFMSDSRVRVLNLEQNLEWYASEWTTDANTFPATVLEDAFKKYVFYIRDCSRINRNVNEVCRELEEVVNVPIDVHVYFSLIEDITKVDTKHGFSVHRDKIDVMLIQAEGTSRFRLWDKDANAETDVPLIDEMLTPGAVVFIPTGCWHEVVSQTKRVSLSFAFGLNSEAKEDRKWISIP